MNYAYLGVIPLEVESIWPIRQNRHHQIGRFGTLLHHFLFDSNHSPYDCYWVPAHFYKMHALYPLLSIRCASFEFYHLSVLFLHISDKRAFFHLHLTNSKLKKNCDQPNNDGLKSTGVLLG